MAMTLKQRILRLINEPFKNHTLFEVLFFGTALIVTFVVLYKIPQDPDLGWHIASGAKEWATKSIPRTDWFSSTFSDFRWVDHEYLSNLLIYGITHFFGKIGLSVTYTLIACATLLVAMKYATVEKVSWANAALYGAFISPIFYYYVGARPQVMPWLFITLVFACIASLKRNPKAKAIYFLPLIFLSWANLHGGSVSIGIVILGTFVLIEGLKTWYFLDGEENIFLQKTHALTLSAYQKLVAMSLIAAVATLANPYGYRIYEEFLRTVTDRYSMSRINEWLPPNFTQPTGVLLLILLFILIEVIYLEHKKKIDFTYMVFFFGFLFLATQSVRHIPLFALVMSPFLLGSSKNLFDTYLGPVLQKKFVFILIAGTALLGVANYHTFFEQWEASKSETAIAQEAGYPEGAVMYLHTHEVPGNMFNLYNWGGYLIEKLPEHKVFIDGRMPHWRNKDLQVFRDYNTIVNVESDYQAKIDHYGVGFFVINHGGTLESTLRQSSQWKEVYSDSKAIIFEKNNE